MGLKTNNVVNLVFYIIVDIIASEDICQLQFMFVQLYNLIYDHMNTWSYLNRYIILITF